MAQAVAGGMDYYQEDSLVGPEISGNRQSGRTIVRNLIIPESAPGAGDAYVRANFAITSELLPPFSIPGQYPLGGNYYVSDYKISGVGSCIAEVSGIPVYEKYRLGVTYAPLDYDPQQDDPQNPGSQNPLQYAEVSVQAGGEYVVLPGSNMWFAGGVAVPDKVASGNLTIAPKTTYSITRHEISFDNVPWTEINDTKGRVNVVDFPTDHYAFPEVTAGTLLFMGATLNTSRTSDGATKRSYSLEFVEWYRIWDNGGGEQRFGWNYLFDPKDEQFKQVFLDRAGTKPVYPTYLTSVIPTLLGN